MGGAAKSTPNEVALARALAALGNPARLALLRELRAKRLLSDIALAAETDRSGPDARPMSRQAVREHLRKLGEIGVVRSEPARHDFGESFTYLVDHRRLYALAEEIRELAGLRPEKDERDDPTQEAPSWRATRDHYPRLLLVRGLGEGSIFALGPDSARAWLIGRKRGAPVRLDYDPFVSLENTILSRGGGRYEVEDLAGSRNGTFVNFERIEPGRPRAIGHGDVLGVGRTLLVFQERPTAR